MSIIQPVYLHIRKQIVFKKRIAFILFLVMAIYSDAQIMIINTVAGNGSMSFSGDGGMAAAAELNSPYGLAIDTAGNVYIADVGNFRVRKVSKAGIITTIAGNGNAGFAGDGGAATAALLNSLTTLASDKAGNIYLSDNYRVRKISTSGIITTVAGNGTSTYPGDGVIATSAGIGTVSGIVADGSGNIYISCPGLSRILKVNNTGIISTVVGTGTSGYSGDGAAATSATIHTPRGIVLDGFGNIFFNDASNYRIRKVNTSGIITTIAGTGTQGSTGDNGAATIATLYNPFSLAIDGVGNLYMDDYLSNQVRKINTSGTITTIAGVSINGFTGDGGLATSAELDSPYGLAADNGGNLYIADSYNSRIRQVNTAGIITTIAGDGYVDYSGDGGLATKAEIEEPTGVCTDGAGNIYIGDDDNNRVRMVNPSGTITTFAGTGITGFSGDGGLATSAKLNSPGSLVKDVAGNIYFADVFNNRIRMINSSGIITTVAGSDTIVGFSGDGGPATSAKLSQPRAIAFDGAGNMYICDVGNNRVRKVDLSGFITTIAGTGTAGYSGDAGAAAAAKLNSPSGVAVDAAGNIYIGDAVNNRIRMVNTSGIISTIAGTGTAGSGGDGAHAISAQLNSPQGMAIDAAGTLYFADCFNSKVRKIDAAGIINTVAGTGTAGFCGDGGGAGVACLSEPHEIALDATGSLYIADNGNSRIRKVSASATGLNQQSELKDVLVYPVPSTGEINISFSGSGYSSLIIYDTFARRIFSRQLDAQQKALDLHIDLTNVCSGIYLMQIFTETGVIYKRLEVAR
jgi:sugar lactone lactonase YvrE